MPGAGPELAALLAALFAALLPALLALWASPDAPLDLAVDDALRSALVAADEPERALPDCTVTDAPPGMLVVLLRPPGPIVTLELGAPLVPDVPADAPEDAPVVPVPAEEE